MNIIKHFFNKILTVLQLILILLFIIFEEIIWEGIAQPIYQYVHSLNIVQRLEKHLAKVNAYVALFIFATLLIIVEVAGLLAGVLFVKGQMITGATLYIAKIPLAAFTFWIFKVTKFKMLSFGFVSWIYKRIIAFMNWLKNLETYQELIATLKEIKTWIKEKFSAFKERFFPKKNGFIEKLKKMYQAIKERLKTTQDDKYTKQKKSDETSQT
ncbi:MAG: hypothetical protein U9N49_06035 [Campylobacterota bacterium]|nr:hypothetical protein [Campylobacterota bacterium]